jgi:hypothetical protein
VGAAGFGGDESWEEGAEFISDFSTCQVLLYEVCTEFVQLIEVFL